ncbi:MAG: transglutaminase domain-containing protein [Patescibacteria group bacterium]
MNEAGARQVEVESRTERQQFAEVLGWQLFEDKGQSKKISLNRQSREVVINPELYPDSIRAQVAAAMAVMKESEAENILRLESKDEIRAIVEGDTVAVADVMLWSSAGRLKETEKQTLDALLKSLSQTESYTQEVKNACFSYIATGSYPNLSPELKPFFDNLPISRQTGQNPISAIADSAVATERRLEYYERFIQPIIQQAKELDRQLEDTMGESFKPSTDDSEGEPLEENEILQRVSPFYGGYYRERVLDAVDWENMEMVATPQPAEIDNGVEIEEATEVKQYLFFGLDGKNLAQGPVSIPLLARARIIKDSLSPIGLVVKRDTKGIHFLSLDQKTGTNAPIGEYQLKFILEPGISDFMAALPTEEESSRVAPDVLFSPETVEKLLELEQLEISDTAKAKRIAGQIRRELTYVNDSQVGEALKVAGRNYFKELESTEKADCDVSNFYLIAQLRSIGIPARMVRGYYPTDQRFGFTPLKGTTMHAWTEYWDAGAKCWKMIDATPPKKEEEQEEGEKQEGSGGNQAMIAQQEEGKISFEGETDDEGLELNDEQLEKFKELFKQKYNEITGRKDQTEQIRRDDFLKEYGITPEEWEKIERFVNSVDQTVIPKEYTIGRADDSTLGEEWDKFFEMFLVAYRLPAKTERTLTRQSLGDDLVDPSSTVTDLLAGSDDPFGFERVKRGEQEIKLPIDFSNDFLLDLTSSMEAADRYGNTLREHQKRFVMEALYHGWKINQGIKNHEGELQGELPFISNHLLSIHGNNQYRELTSGQKEIAMTQLSEVMKLLDETEQGAGNMIGALEQYRNALLAQPEVIQKIRSGQMVKTLTILSDGNMWCSACGKESCSYSLSTEEAAKSKRLVEELRRIGVIVNAIGFTGNSRHVIDIFDDKTDPGRAIVADNVEQAVVMHHKQLVKSWQVIEKAAEYRQFSLA